MSRHSPDLRGVRGWRGDHRCFLNPTGGPPTAGHPRRDPAVGFCGAAARSAGCFRKLFDEAHIIAAAYAGPGGESVGLALLRERVAKLPKDSAIVIYCGCCPWDHCPNIGAAFSELRRLGFRHVKALYIAHDFGTDWIEKGYPVAKGG